MAKVKSGLVLLGTVVKKHDSGICDTDLGKSVSGKFEIGTVLMMDSKTRKVSVKESTKSASKDKTPVNPPLDEGNQSEDLDSENSEK